MGCWERAGRIASWALRCWPRYAGRAAFPARLVSGFLIHPANIGPHAWTEARLAPGLWVPFDFGSWCYSAGNPEDPQWGGFYRGRIDARFLAETAPREFTGWGSAPPPQSWYRLESLEGERIVHTLYRCRTTGCSAATAWSSACRVRPELRPAGIRVSAIPAARDALRRAGLPPACPRHGTGPAPGLRPVRPPARRNRP